MPGKTPLLGLPERTEAAGARASVPGNPLAAAAGVEEA